MLNAFNFGIMWACGVIAALGSTTEAFVVINSTLGKTLCQWLLYWTCKYEEKLTSINLHDAYRPFRISIKTDKIVKIYLVVPIIIAPSTFYLFILFSFLRTCFYWTGPGKCNNISVTWVIMLFCFYGRKGGKTLLQWKVKDHKCKDKK